MPIRPELKDLYPPNRDALSKRMFERAGNRCEQFGCETTGRIWRRTLWLERKTPDEPKVNG